MEIVEFQLQARLERCPLLVGVIGILYARVGLVLVSALREFRLATTSENSDGYKQWEAHSLGHIVIYLARRAEATYFNWHTMHA